MMNWFHYNIFLFMNTFVELENVYTAIPNINIDRLLISLFCCCILTNHEKKNIIRMQCLCVMEMFIS